MMRKFILIAGLLVLAAGGMFVVAQAQHRMSMPQPEVKLLSSVATAPMDLSSGLPVVQVMINGKGPFPFVLDTGAAGTVISETLTQELKLEIQGEMQVHSPMGNHPIPGKLVRMEKLEMGQVVLSNVLAVSFDASRVFNKPNAPRGVLSANSFSGYLLSLNYPQSKIELRAGELPSSNGKDILDFDASRPLVSMPIRVAGKEVLVDVDSGSRGEIMLPLKYAKELPLSGELTQAETMHTVDATVEHQRGTLNGTIQIGGFSLQNPSILFSEAPNGNLGSQFLSRFILTLDRKNHRIQLETPGSGSKDGSL